MPASTHQAPLYTLTYTPYTARASSPASSISSSTSASPLTPLSNPQDDDEDEDGMQRRAQYAMEEEYREEQRDAMDEQEDDGDFEVDPNSYQPAPMQQQQQQQTPQRPMMADGRTRSASKRNGSTSLATPTSTHSGASLMDQIVGGSGGGSASSKRIAQMTASASASASNSTSAGPSRRDTRVSSFSSVESEARPPVIEYIEVDAPPPHHVDEWSRIHMQMPPRSQSAMAGVPLAHGPPPHGHGYPPAWIAVGADGMQHIYHPPVDQGYRAYAQPVQTQPHRHQAHQYQQAPPHAQYVQVPPPQALQRHHTSAHLVHPGPSQMMRSYSDPFAGLPPHAQGQASPAVGYADLTGMKLNIGMGAGAMENGVAMESIAGRPVGTYQTPVRFGAGMGEPGSAATTKTYDSSNSSPSEASEARAQPQQARSRSSTGTPASTGYSAGGSSYHPSVERDRAGMRRVQQAKEESEEEDDGEYVVDQGSPTRRGALARVTKTLKPVQRQPAPQQDLAAKAIAGMAPRPIPVGPPAPVKKAPVKGAQAAAGGKADDKNEYIPENVPPGERSKEKPGVSYAAIIGQAILASSRKRLSLAQIYAWISAAYPFFKPGDAGWQNSIRHNLSLNECFVKAQRASGEASGKGSYWMIKPELEFQFEGGNFKKSNGRPKAAPKKKAGAASKTSTPVLVNAVPQEAPTSSPHPAHMMPYPPMPPQHMQTMHMPPQPITMGPFSDFQPHTMPPTITQPPVAMSDPTTGPTSTKKRKSTDPAETAQPPAFAAPHESTSPSLRPAALQESPMAADASAKRAKLDTESWSTPAPTNAHRAPPLIRKTSSNQVGIMAEEPSMRRSTDAAFRPPPSSSPSVGYAPERLRRTSPEPTPVASSFGNFAPVPSALLERAASRSRRSRKDVDDDDFVTPQKPMPTDVIPSSSSLSALPHLTPSASSPVSSPAPATVTRSGMQLRRTQLFQSASACEMGSLTSDAPDDMVKIAGDSDGSDESDQVTTDRVNPQIAKRAAAHPVKTTSLGPAVVFATPAVPTAKVKQTERLAEAGAEFEHVTLSPMTTRPASSVPRVNLPGPSDLLLSSPNTAGRRANNAVDRDLLTHLDRVATSPVAKSKKDSFATPGDNGVRATRFATMTRSSAVTPLRSSAALNHLNHETPAGLSKLFFKAEHGLFDSPNGVMGSCYDMGEPGYLLEQEMDRMQSQTAHSPTGVHAKKSSVSYASAGWGKMLWDPKGSP